MPEDSHQHSIHPSVIFGEDEEQKIGEGNSQIEVEDPPMNFGPAQQDISPIRSARWVTSTVSAPIRAAAAAASQPA